MPGKNPQDEINHFLHKGSKEFLMNSDVFSHNFYSQDTALFRAINWGNLPDPHMNYIFIISLSLSLIPLHAPTTHIFICKFLTLKSYSYLNYSSHPAMVSYLTLRIYFSAKVHRSLLRDGCQGRISLTTVQFHWSY